MLFMSGAPLIKRTRRPLILNQMKRYIILGALLVSAALARADLGDNYASTCKEFNDRGAVSKDWIWYAPMTEHKTGAWCQFRKNRCVAIGYQTTGAANEYIIDSEIWRLLLANSKGVTWNEYSVTTAGTHCYVSADGLMFASLTQNKQRLLVAYKTW